MQRLLKYQSLFMVSVFLSCFMGCHHFSGSPGIAEFQAAPVAIDPVQAEKDEICLLTAYSVVLKDWQQRGPDQRGHNIGSILTDPDGKIVNWARNCNHITQNGTQHGEVRLMIGYIDKIRSYSLKGYTVYTSLEPCAQCSGMMTLVSIGRTVYGQTDPGYGKALERLQLDTHELPELLPDKFPKGYVPYPRAVQSEMSPCIIRKKLDAAYKKAGGSITGFLLTDTAKNIYNEAHKMLIGYQVQYRQNQQYLNDAIDFLKTVPDHYTPIKPDI